MTNPQFNSALQEWKKQIGTAYVLHDEATIQTYGRGTSPFDKNPLAVLKPVSTEEVQAVVRIAAQYRIALYPVSRGKNWGYGEMCSPNENNVVLDLSRMNRILEVNQRLAYAVIEPGVSQEQLYDYLEKNHIPLKVDTTGAPPTASILGNILERGYGFSHYSDHYLSSSGMEVVLADGSTLKTGFGHFQNSKNQYLHKWGIGPTLDGIFSQSNLGIVTKIGVWLAPKPEYHGIISLNLKDDASFGEAIETTRRLKLEGILPGTFHFFNDVRAMSSICRYPWKETKGVTPLPEDIRKKMAKKFGLCEWNGIGILSGTKRQVLASWKEIKKAFRGTGQIRFAPHSLLNFVYRWRHPLTSILGKTFIKKLSFIGIARGIPTWEPCDALFWRKKGPSAQPWENSLQENCGLIWISPVIPMTREEVAEFIKSARRLCQKYAFEFNVSINIFTERAVDCVLGILYDKAIPEENKKAKECHDALLAYCLENGFIPYRAGIGSMKALAQPGDPFWQTVKKMKDTFDPHHIIAPGRYCPD